MKTKANIQLQLFKDVTNSTKMDKALISKKIIEVLTTAATKISVNGMDVKLIVGLINFRYELKERSTKLSEKEFKVHYAAELDNILGALGVNPDDLCGQKLVEFASNRYATMGKEIPATLSKLLNGQDADGHELQNPMVKKIIAAAIEESSLLYPGRRDFLRANSVNSKLNKNLFNSSDKNSTAALKSLSTSLNEIQIPEIASQTMISKAEFNLEKAKDKWLTQKLKEFKQSLTQLSAGEQPLSKEHLAAREQLKNKVIREVLAPHQDLVKINELEQLNCEQLVGLVSLLDKGGEIDATNYQSAYALVCEFGHSPLGLQLLTNKLLRNNSVLRKLSGLIKNDAVANTTKNENKDKWCVILNSLLNGDTDIDKIHQALDLIELIAKHLGTRVALGGVVAKAAYTTADDTCYRVDFQLLHEVMAEIAKKYNLAEFSKEQLATLSHLLTPSVSSTDKATQLKSALELVSKFGASTEVLKFMIDNHIHLTDTEIILNLARCLQRYAPLKTPGASIRAYIKAIEYLITDKYPRENSDWNTKSLIAKFQTKIQDFDLNRLELLSEHKLGLSDINDIDKVFAGVNLFEIHGICISGLINDSGLPFYAACEFVRQLDHVEAAIFNLLKPPLKNFSLKDFKEIVVPLKQLDLKTIQEKSPDKISSQGNNLLERVGGELKKVRSVAGIVTFITDALGLKNSDFKRARVREVSVAGTKTLSDPKAKLTVTDTSITDDELSDFKKILGAAIEDFKDDLADAGLDTSLIKLLSSASDYQLTNSKIVSMFKEVHADLLQSLSVAVTNLVQQHEKQK